MKLALPWILGALGVMASGCAAEEGEPEPDADDQVDRLAPEDDLDVEDDVCPIDRHIVWRKVAGDCPAFGNWTGVQIFRAGTTWLAGNDHTVTKELAMACGYTWVPSTGAESPTQADVTALYGKAIFQVGQAGPDCEVVLPQTGPINDKITDQIDVMLEDNFLASIGSMDAVQLGLTGNDFRRRVDVMIVDTQPHPAQPNPRSKHGETVARIIEEVACPNGTTGCAVRSQRVLGLPRWSGGVDEVRGGYFGSFWNLASAIKEGTERWWAMNKNLAVNSRSRLIINLSVGWHPYAAFNVGGPGERAVKLALEEARCRGAQVIVAAGNSDSFPHEIPLLPAGWEALAAPTGARCSAIGAPPPAAYGSTYAPLVHSAGGLDIHGDALESGRVGGRPRFAVAGSHVLVGAPSSPTTALTGTSMSTAGLTSLAALVWGYNGMMAPDRVMQEIYEGAETLDEAANADYWLVGQVQPGIRRPNACTALQEACNGACPAIDFSGGCDTTWPASDDIPDAIAALQHQKFVGIAFAPAALCKNFAGETIKVRTPAGAPSKCAAAEYDPRDRYLTPQPPTPLCTDCALKVEVKPQTRASLNDDYANDTVDSLVIEVTHADGTIEAFDYGANVALKSDEITLVDLPTLSTNSEIQHATVTISLASGYRQTDDLILDREP